LGALADDPQTLLPILLARDQVEDVLGKARPLPVEGARQLLELDGQLRHKVTEPTLKPTAAIGALSTWRQTFHPPDARWWWFLDQKAEEREKEQDLVWVLLTGTLLLLTATLTVEILKRLWAGAPDLVSVFASLLTLVVTASPLVKRGQELAQWTLKRIPWLKPRFRAEAMVGMAAFAFVAVLAGWLLLPQLALIYNNQGFAALRAGDLAGAKSKFQRAVALTPDLEVPYYNLAGVYHRIGRPDEAKAWYQQAIERDLNYALAYRGLGHLHNAQGEHEQAETVLLAGLFYLDKTAGGEPEQGQEHEKEETVARYALLADLGWAYFAQGQYERAQEALEAAVTLEEQIRPFEEAEGAQYRLPLPHYYLAQVYEQLERPSDAYHEWEDCLRLLGRGWESKEWRAMAVEHIEKWEERLE
jgi:tetratricopeptide (TPR) repeat protein